MRGVHSPEDYTRYARVRRLLYDLLHVLHAAAVGVAGLHEGGAVNHVVDRLHKSILKRDHQRDRLHDRAGFVGEYRTVQCLAISAVFKQLYVRYGLDFSRLYLHEYGCAPFGLGFGADFVKLLLQHVLKVDVDCGMYVVATARRGCHPIAYAVGESYLLCESGLAVEQRVEVLFQSGITMYLSGLAVLVHAADAAVSHLAIGVDTRVAAFLVERMPPFYGFKERKALDALIVLKCLFLCEAQRAGTDRVRFLELFLQARVPRIFLDCVGRLRKQVGYAWVIHVERVGQRVD